MKKTRANGQMIAYEKAGEGPPLLLIHGNEADHTMFDRLLPYLTPSFTVITYDQRDCGLTENETAAYSLNDLGDDAAALLASLGIDQAFVYGSSLGGQIAQAMVDRHPHRVARLVLGNTWKVGTDIRARNAEVFAAMAAYRSDLDANAPKIAQYFFPAAFILQHPEVTDMFRDNGRTTDQRARRAGAILASSPTDLAKFPRDILVITGDEDRLILPEITLALADGLPQARTSILSGIGHVGAVQAPDLIAAELREFLLQ